jgi:GTP pyrophosphokinase
MLSNYAYRVIKARWKSQKLEEREVALKLQGIDDVGIVNSITHIISMQHSVNMRSISFESEDGIFNGHIKLLVYDTEHLESLITKFEQIEGIKFVERITEKINVS